MRIKTTHAPAKRKRGNRFYKPLKTISRARIFALTAGLAAQVFTSAMQIAVINAQAGITKPERALKILTSIKQSAEAVALISTLIAKHQKQLLKHG